MTSPLKYFIFLTVFMCFSSLAALFRRKRSKSRTSEITCPTETCQQPLIGATNSKFSTCVGIRGNAQNIFSHFPSLARIVEELGPISAAAGGSSASVTTFFLESIQSNPLVSSSNCNGPDGATTRQRARISFLLKSVEGMNDYVGIIHPFGDDVKEKVLSDVKSADILERLKRSDATALDDLKAILTSSDMDQLINPKFDSFLEESPDPIFHAIDTLNDMVPFIEGEFSVDSPKYFVRPMPFSFQGAARNHDVVASFYRGYAPANMEKMEALLEECAVPSLGKEWTVASQITTSSGKTCGDVFGELVRDFLDNRDVKSGHPSRLEDELGTDSMLSIVAVSILTGKGIEAYEKAKAAYLAADVPISWDMNFDDVKFGYWGKQDILRSAPISSFPDLKSQKARILSRSTWGEMIVRSPSEPGLSEGIYGPEGEYVSIGGWGDLAPAQILASVGCGTILLVTRPAGAGTFQLSVEGALNATPEDIERLNSLENNFSSWNAALRLANGTMCGDWEDEETGNDNRGLANVGWVGPLVTEDRCMQDAFCHAPDLKLEASKSGCSAMRPATRLRAASVE